MRKLSEVTSTPAPLLPEIRLPAPAAAPPTVPLAPSAFTPAKPLPRALSARHVGADVVAAGDVAGVEKLDAV